MWHLELRATRSDTYRTDQPGTRWETHQIGTWHRTPGGPDMPTWRQLVGLLWQLYQQMTADPESVPMNLNAMPPDEVKDR